MVTPWSSSPCLLVGLLVHRAGGHVEGAGVDEHLGPLRRVQHRQLRKTGPASRFWLTSGGSAAWKEVIDETERVAQVQRWETALDAKNSSSSKASAPSWTPSPPVLRPPGSRKDPAYRASAFDALVTPSSVPKVQVSSAAGPWKRGHLPRHALERLVQASPVRKGSPPRLDVV